MSTPIIEFKEVSKRYGSNHLMNNVNFAIMPGETVVFMGPSGCGKTTILRCINGLEKVDSGSITVQDVNITRPPKGFNWNTYRAQIGVVFQNYNLFPHLTVLQNVTLAPIKVKGTSPEEAKANAFSLLGRMGLETKADRFPHNLSGGEKQRVAIARALAMSPDILLFDEPTSALDPLMTGEVLQTIQELSHQGITLIVVTHEVRFALDVADRIFFINNGKIELEGPPAIFLKPLEHPVAQHYFASFRIH